MKTKHPLVIFSILGILFTFFYILHTDAPLPTTRPLREPLSSPYPEFIAASGITEANTRNIEIGTNISGLISEVMVSSDGVVKKGDPLFKIDDWEVAEKIKVKNSEYLVKEGLKDEAEIALSEANRLLSNSVELESKKVVSKDEMLSKRYNVKLAEAKLGTIKNEMQLALTEIDSLKTELDKHIVRSPVDGTVLQVNVKAGEYSQTGVGAKVNMVVGNINPMYIRVDIDEYDAWRFNKDGEAIAVLKDNSEFKVPLTFVRKEPLVIPKVSLGGNINEKIDTRVFQVVYSFDPANVPVYIGQQMDVFVKTVGKSDK